MMKKRHANSVDQMDGQKLGKNLSIIDGTVQHKDCRLWSPGI
jgi:hypothetical protein